LLARAACEQLQLDEVRWLPVGTPAHKQRSDLTDLTHRVAMIGRLIANDPCFQIDLTDATRPGPHRTVTLLPLIRAARPEAALWFLIGGDSLRDFGTWVEPEQILALTRLAVLPRPGAEPDWPALTARFPTLPERVDWLDGALLDVSSTALRQSERLRRRLLPAGVRAYIRQHGLYNRS
jgi:nicotinate-nucleotide adenylyltransferase